MSSRNERRLQRKLEGEKSFSQQLNTHMRNAPRSPIDELAAFREQMESIQDALQGADASLFGGQTETPAILYDVSKFPSDLTLPTRATSGAACADIQAAVEDPVVLHPSQYTLIPTGLYMEIPQGYAVEILSRSGLAAKWAVFVANAPGIIDSDYRGEVKVILLNAGAEPITINRGDRIAQMRLVPVQTYTWGAVSALGEADRGTGGFGSTGVSETLKAVPDVDVVSDPQKHNPELGIIDDSVPWDTDEDKIKALQGTLKDVPQATQESIYHSCANSLGGVVDTKTLIPPSEETHHKKHASHHSNR